MRNRFEKYLATKRSSNPNIIQYENQIPSNSDNHIDQDFPGFPHAPSTEAMIDPKSLLEKIVAGVETIDEKRKISS